MFQGRKLLRRNGGAGLRDPLSRDPQASGIGFEAVEARGIVEQCRVAALAHRSQNVRHRRIDIRLRRPLGADQFGKRRLEAGIGPVKPPHRHRASPLPG